MILKTRLHMTKLPCNYRNGEMEDCCWLCGNGDVKTEHFYSCKGTYIQRKTWNSKVEDLTREDLHTLVNTSKFLEKVAELYRPKWEAMNDVKGKCETKKGSEPLQSNVVRVDGGELGR